MKLLTTTALGAILLSAPVWANPVQVNQSGSPAQSQVYGDGSAASSSHSTTGPSTSSATGGKGGKASVTVNVGSSDPTAGAANKPTGSSGATHAHKAAQADTSNNGVHIPVASADAPAVMNFNPCSGSAASGAAQFAPFGLSFGTGGGFDNACRLHMLGKDRAAVAYLCRVNSEIRQAFRDVGEPCPQDEPVPVQVQVVRGVRTDDPPDSCYTTDAGERRQHKECKGVRYE